jgi:hypothetical protein
VHAEPTAERLTALRAFSMRLSDRARGAAR